jgi:transcription elongation GreA/GreB family factor
VNELDGWSAAVREALDLGDGTEGERKLVLDLARDVAHGVLRPAAPLSAYLLGLAVGRGADPQAAAATVTDLVGRWAATHPHAEG